MLRSIAASASKIPVIRRAVVQEHRLDLGIKATVLRVDYRTRHVLCITVSKLQPQVLRLVAIVAHPDGQHMQPGEGPADRKSTRLNSSHSQISYAVFCLK